MLGLWLHTPLVKGQGNFTVPVRAEIVDPLPGTAGFNTGNEAIVANNAEYAVQVYEANGTSHISFYENGVFLHSSSLGTIGTGIPDLAFVKDPDVSGVYCPILNKVLFIVVYEAYIDNVSNAISGWIGGTPIIYPYANGLYYEVWEVDLGPPVTVNPSAITTPPPALRSAIFPPPLWDPTPELAPNVDVNERGGVAIGFRHNGEGVLFIANDLCDQTQTLVDLDPAHGASINTHNSCILDIDFPIMDVTTSFNPHTLEEKVHVVYTNMWDVGVRSYEFSSAYDLSFNLAPPTCGVDMREHVVDMADILSNPRISSHGFDASSSSPGSTNVDEFAITYKVNYHYGSGEYINVSFGEYHGGVYMVDYANTHVYTTLCDQGRPAISYINGNDNVVVAWKFYDCGDCILNDRSDCYYGGYMPPTTFQPGVFVVAKQYDMHGNRVYGHELARVNNNTLDPWNAAVSVSGKNLDISTPHNTGNVHFCYLEANTQELIHKLSDAPMPQLRPDRDNYLSIEAAAAVNAEFRILQNPVQHELVLSSDINFEALNQLNIQFTDVNGRSIAALNQQGLVMPYGTTKVFNTSFLSSGIYFIRVNETNLKFVKL